MRKFPINILMDPPMYEEVKRIAKSKDITANEFVRRAIEAQIQQERRQESSNEREDREDGVPGAQV